MSVADRISRGVSASFAARVIDTAVNGLLIVLLARYLMTPEQYGLLFYALSVVGVIASLGRLGIPQSAARYVTEYGEVDRDQVRYVIRASVGYLLLLSVIVGLAMSLGSRFIASFLDEPDLAPILALGGGYIVFESLRKLMGNLFQGLNRVDLSALVQTLSAITRFVAVIGLVLLGLGAVGAFLGYIVGFAVATVLGGVILYRRFYRTYDPDVDRDEDLIRRMLEYSVPLTATTGANMLDKQVDTILVGVLINPLAVAYYTVGKQVAQVAGTPAKSLGTTVSPTVGEQKAGKREDRAALIYERSLEAILILYVPAAVGLFLVATPLVRMVFGDGYAGAIPIIQLFSIYVLLSAITQITSPGLDFLGRARHRAIIKTTLSVANFGLNLLLIPLIGVIGAAIATVVTHSIYVGATIFLITRELPVSFDRVGRSLGLVSGVSLVMAIGVTGLRPYISGVPSLLGVIVFGVAIWAVASVASGLVDVRELREYFA